MSSHKFAFFRFSTWILFYSLFCFSSAGLKTHYVEDLCGFWPQKDMYLRNIYSGILSSISSKSDSGECTIRLHPEFGYSVVLSIYRYQLSPEDRLTITDSDKFQVALIGEGDFPDERKSFTSDGLMTIQYAWNNTEHVRSRVKFQFVFTQVHKSPCRFDEFQCRNKYCLSEDYVCDGHNHCGDKSEQENCGLKINTPPTVTVKKSTSVWIISIIVCSVILAIVIIVFIVMAIRGNTRRKNKQKTVNPPLTVISTVPQKPTAPVEEQTPPSMFTRFRQSLRGMRSPVAPKPEEPKADNYQVPSMYPKLPTTSQTEEKKADNYQAPSMYPDVTSAPQLSGVVNPEFKGDEA